jgi:hypothetical protein
VEDIDFELISAAENSKKFQKTRFFGRKNQLRTLGPMAQATLV